ncbi:MAG TPA: nucleotidyltransferase family protein [Gemmataceae bacterium]|nr:nucleotidyltransferase family protein [Gemmataceae bacterium]
MRFAVLPAAGKSIRMGRPKLVLPLGDRTILEHVVAALRQAEVEHILVVIGPHVPELAVLAEDAGALVCQLAEETADMRMTVEHGLHWLEERFQPQPNDGWLLVPADHPTLDPGVVRQLDQARRTYPERSIFLPTFQGRRGHPLLLSWRHAEEIRAQPAGQGLNIYVRQRAADTLEVPVEMEAILWDLDTPEDYERLRRG